MNPPSHTSPSSSSTASIPYTNNTATPSSPKPHSNPAYHHHHHQAADASAALHHNHPSHSTGPGSNTRGQAGGRHLHLLAPLTNRINASLPAIRIPDRYPSHNPSVSTSSSTSSTGAGYTQHHYHHSSARQTQPPVSPYNLYPSPNAPFSLASSSTGTTTSQDAYLSSAPYPHSSGSGFASGNPYGHEYDERSLRSPHPPLTAGLRPPVSSDGRSLWPPPLSSFDSAHSHSTTLHSSSSRPYYSSPLITEGTSAPGHATYTSRSPIESEPHVHTHARGRNSVNYHPALPGVPPPTATKHHRTSPLVIPPPLTFKYSQSPPPSASLSTFAQQQQSYYQQQHHLDPYTYGHYDPYNMPPRRKLAAAEPTSATPQTVSSSTSSLRKPRGPGYQVEHTYDSVGQKKEILVIEDSQSPANGAITRKRTRAVAAAEAAAANGTHGIPNGHASMSTTASVKKRKVDEVSDAGSVKKVKPAKAGTAGSTHVKPLPKKVQEQVAATSGTSTPWDDTEGHYIIKPEDFIGQRYRIIRLLGQGTFGKVVEAKDVQTRAKVAIKIIRAVQKYRDASKIEIRVLETLKKHDPSNLNKCVHLEEYFDFRNHPCLVTELYGMSVFDFLKQNGFQPFPERHIQDFAKSLLKSVDFVHRLKLVHTDLKPENILLCSNESKLSGPRVKGSKSKSILKNTDIRLIDFGSATFENEYHSSVVSTRHYRAPEIILGIPWSYPCDLFSIGCILVEFYTGDALFQTHDNLEHLAMMEIVMGKMPRRMVDKGSSKKPEFFKNHKVDYPNASVSRSSRKFLKTLRPLSEIIKPINTHNKLFLDLIVRLLDFDPDSRITVSQALHHPYCQLDIPPPSLT